MKKKYLILAIILLCLSLISITIAIVLETSVDNPATEQEKPNNNLEEQEKPESSEFDYEIKLANFDIVENMILKNLMVENQPQGSIIEFELKNKTNNTLNIKQFNLNFYDNENNLMITIPGYTNPINKNESKKIVLSTSKDLKLATRYTIEVIYE